MEKRLCGREQEFGIKICYSKKFNKKGITDSEDVENYVLEKILDVIPKLFPAIRVNEELWLQNGSKIYIDGSKFEAATAEYSAGSLDGVRQEKALEHILVKATQIIIKESKGLEFVILYKNNVGPSDKGLYKNEATYGTHYNYSYLESRKSEVFSLMRNFIPASLILTGNGHVLRSNSGKVVYVISQRARHIKKMKADRTTSDRPLLNTRDQSLMHVDSGLARFHLISRDAARCEFQSWLVDGVTHLVLRLGESGWSLPKNLILKDPVSIMHKINFFVDKFNYKIPLCGRSPMNILDYNFIFLNAAKQLKELSADEKKILDSWEWVLKMFKSGNSEKLKGYLDWTTKLFLLKRMMKEYSFGLNDNRAWRISQGYHAINPKFSWYKRLEEAGYIHHLVSRESIKKAVFTAPMTRARSRGDFIKFCLKHPSLKSKIYIMDWPDVDLKFGQDSIYFGEPNNPFSPISSDFMKFKKNFKK